MNFEPTEADCRQMLGDLNSRLARFDEEQSAILARYTQAMNEARSDESRDERRRRAVEHYDLWRRARRPMVQEIIQVTNAMADAFPPPLQVVRL